MATQRTGATATNVTGDSHLRYGVFASSMSTVQDTDKSIAILRIASFFSAPRQAACQIAVSVPMLAADWLAPAYMAYVSK